MVSENTLMKRSEASELLALLDELKALGTQKRDAFEDDLSYEIYMDKRESAIGNFISALLNSGIIGDVFTTLTTDEGLKTEVYGLVKAAVQGALVRGPALIKAIWNAGLIQEIFNKFINDTELRSAFLGVIKSVISTAINLITNRSGSSTTTTASAAAKRELESFATPAPVRREVDEMFKRDLMDGNDEFLDKRDLVSIISYVVTTIKDSGIVQSLFKKVIENPTQTVNFLTSALKTGLVVVEEVYGWAKSSGILDSALNYLKANGSGFISSIFSFIGLLLGSGSLSAADITSATTTGVTYATNTATTTAASYNNDISAIFSAAGAAGTTTTTSFTTATTLVKRRMFA